MKFDFDSAAPVQGNVIDEKYEQTKTEMWHRAIGYVLAIDVTCLGFWLDKWWISGGFKWMGIFMRKFAPGFMHMVEAGL